MEPKNIIITVGRQLGSGGHDIARMLALDFNAQYYDREILNLAARESGFSPKIFEQNDEKKGFVRSLFSVQIPFVDNGMYKPGFSQDSLFKFQSDAIRKEAQKGSCVFVGRCADYVLRDFQNTVSVFITAPMDFRIQSVASKQGVQPDEARKLIEHGERRRAEYYNYYTGKKWGHASGYDLCIDSSILGLQQTEQFIASFVRSKLKI